jgi:hypothetical protein
LLQTVSYLANNLFIFVSMLRNLHTRIVRHSRKLLVATVLVGIAGLAFSSMGGEKRNKKSSSVPADFTPIRTTAGFTLRAGPSYKGSLGFNQNKASNPLNFNTLITYQKGNTTYILPYNHRVNIGSCGSSDNTQMLHLKVRMHK